MTVETDSPATPLASRPAARIEAQPIRFWHRGRIVEVLQAHTTRSVLDWLREDARCTGTKEGCNEGDCGACTVVIGELDSPSAAGGQPTSGEGGGLRLHTVNACMQFLPTLHGKALFTVESLQENGGPLHPVQKAMVDCHGSQCGFCTPGFVMSMWSLYEATPDKDTPPSRQAVADALSGNLCRCTGYRPILDAAEAAFAQPAVALDRAPVVAALESLRGGPPLSRQAPNPAQRQADGQPRIDRYWAPSTLEELAALRLAHPAATLLAGSTDIGLWVTKQFRDLGDLIWLGEVAELRVIETLPPEAGSAPGGWLRIGAGASLEEAWAALARRWPHLTEVWLRFASPPIRHAGTMGGNVANGSPIGDSAPVLMALNAAIELRRGQRVRVLPLDDFYLGYMKNRLEPGEFVQALRVPLPPDTRADGGPSSPAVRAYKISKRFDCDISAVCAGLALGLDAEGWVTHARFAFGGMAATVARARAAEAAVLGRPWDETTLEAAQQALAADFTPLTDLRASAAYRRQVASNLLRRLWLETRLQAPLPPEALRAFPAR